MSELDQCLMEAQACNAMARGKTISCRINGISYPCLESILSIEDILIDGGYASANGFQVNVLKSLFLKPPQQLDPIVSSEGDEMKIQKIQVVNDSYIIWAYDSAGVKQ